MEHLDPKPECKPAPVFRVRKTQKRDPTQRLCWTKTQDKELCSLVQKHGDRHWKEIGEEMAKKYPGLPVNGKKCRERWLNSAQSGVNREPLSEKEDVMLISLHHSYSNQWSSIAKKFQNRNSSCLKNNFYSMIKKVVRQISLHSKGQAIQNVTPSQFLCSIYISLLIMKLLKSASDFNSSSEAEKLQSLPHIIDYILNAHISSKSCRSYIEDIKECFSSNCPSLPSSILISIKNMDYEGVTNLMDRIIPFARTNVKTMDPNEAICRAFQQASMKASVPVSSPQEAHTVPYPPQPMTYYHPAPIPFINPGLKMTQTLRADLSPYYPQFCLKATISTLPTPSFSTYQQQMQYYHFP